MSSLRVIVLADEKERTAKEAQHAVTYVVCSDIVDILIHDTRDRDLQIYKTMS